MDLLVNIILIGLQVVIAVTAIGGETWRQGTAPLRHRITQRGWIAMSALLATLLLGMTKEIRSHRATTESAEELKLLQGKLTESRDESRRLLTTVVYALPPSEGFKDLVAGYVEEIARDHKLPAPVTIKLEGGGLHFDFQDEHGRSGYLAFAAPDLAKLAIFNEDELRKAILEIFDETQKYDNKNRTALVNQLAIIAAPFFQHNFGSSSNTTEDQGEAIVIYPSNDNDEQTSKERLTIQRNEIVKLLNLPNYKRGAALANKCDSLR